MSFFSLNIITDNLHETYVGISEVLNLFPDDHYDSANPNSEWKSIYEERYCLWVYSEDFFDTVINSEVINSILDAIEPNFVHLEKLGITKDKIFFILHTETESCTDIIFNSKDMLRLGKIGIELTISNSIIKD